MFVPRHRTQFARISLQRTCRNPYRGQFIRRSTGRNNREAGTRYLAELFNNSIELVIAKARCTILVRRV